MSRVDQPLAGVSILLVEDDDDARELLELVLRRAGAVVRSVSTATDALEVFKTSPTTVVLTDIAMPERDGFWLLQAIRSAPSLPRVPVVALTALAMAKDRADVRAAGFDAHITKPSDPDDVVQILADTVGIRCRSRDAS
jgi:CheY-like chemotaxis protein